MIDGWPYACPVCGGEIEAERFGDEHVYCPHCGTGPYATAHDCYDDEEAGDEWCSDWLESPTT